MPSWETISQLSKDNKNLIVTKFNCDSPTTNTNLCKILSVDRFPSIVFIGYGDFNQIPLKGNIFSKSSQPKIVRYLADLYPEALYEWINSLSHISKMQRGFDTFKNLFTGIV